MAEAIQEMVRIENVIVNVRRVLALVVRDEGEERSVKVLFDTGEERTIPLKTAKREEIYQLFDVAA